MPEQPSLLVNIVLAFLVVLQYALPIIGLMWFLRYLRRGTDERRRLRMEISKLAEEVSLMRQQQSKD